MSVIELLAYIAKAKFSYSFPRQQFSEGLTMPFIGLSFILFIYLFFFITICGKSNLSSRISPTLRVQSPLIAYRPWRRFVQ